MLRTRCISSGLAVMVSSQLETTRTYTESTGVRTASEVSYAPRGDAEHIRNPSP